MIGSCEDVMISESLTRMLWAFLHSWW